MPVHPHEPPAGQLPPATERKPPADFPALGPPVPGPGVPPVVADGPEAVPAPPQPATAGARAWGLLLVLAGIWGTSFILMKRGLEVFSALELGGARVVIASLCLLPFAVHHLPRTARPKLKYLFVSGAVGTLVPAFLFAYAETRLASGLAGVLNSLTGLFTLLVGAAFFRQKLTALRVLGIGVGLAGTAVLILLGSGASVAGDGATHGLWIVLATFCYGISVNTVKTYLSGLPPLGVSSVSLVLVLPLAAVYLFGFSDFTHKLAAAPGAWTALGYIGLLALFSTAVGLILFNKLIRISSTLFAASSTYLIPVVALGWGVADGEVIRLWHYVGMVVILAGVALVNRAK